MNFPSQLVLAGMGWRVVGLRHGEDSSGGRVPLAAPAALIARASV